MRDGLGFKDRQRRVWLGQRPTSQNVFDQNEPMGKELVPWGKDGSTQCMSAKRERNDKRKILLLPSDALLQASHGPSHSRRLGVYRVWLAEAPLTDGRMDWDIGMDWVDDAKSV
jgi:hypothetical protein